MTDQRLTEWLLPCTCFAKAPQPGDHYAMEKGKRALAVAVVRRVVGGRGGEQYRLLGVRVPCAAVPGGVAPLPYPASPRRAKAPPAEVPASTPAVIVKPAEVKRLARKRVVGLLKDDKADGLVPTVRIDNGSVEKSKWRDPDDNNPNRRTAREVQGYRATDVIENLLTIGTLSKVQARSGRRFRKLYELGCVGLSGSRPLDAVQHGYASGTGPSESRSLYLSAYQETCTKLGPSLLHIIMAVVIQEQTVTAYAEARRMNRGAAVGYLLGALDCLTDHFKAEDEARRASAEQPPHPFSGPPA